MSPFRQKLYIKWYTMYEWDRSLKSRYRQIHGFYGYGSPQWVSFTNCSTIHLCWVRALSNHGRVLRVMHHAKYLIDITLLCSCFLHGLISKELPRALVSCILNLTGFKTFVFYIFFFFVSYSIGEAFRMVVFMVCKGSYTEWFHCVYKDLNLLYLKSVFPALVVLLEINTKAAFNSWWANILDLYWRNGQTYVVRWSKDGNLRLQPCRWTTFLFSFIIKKRFNVACPVS